MHANERAKTSPKTYAHDDEIAVFETDVVWWSERDRIPFKNHLRNMHFQHIRSLAQCIIKAF